MEEHMDGKDILQKSSVGNRQPIDCCHFDFSMKKGDTVTLCQDAKYRDRTFSKGTKAVFSHYDVRNRCALPPGEEYDNVDAYFAWFHVGDEERVRVLGKEEIEYENNL